VDCYVAPKIMKNLLLFLWICLLTFSNCTNTVENKNENRAQLTDTSGSVTIGGTKLRYLVQGKGAPQQVVLRGFMMLSLILRIIIKEQHLIIWEM